jgi:hypothetical protein
LESGRSWLVYKGSMTNIAKFYKTSSSLCGSLKRALTTTACPVILVSIFPRNRGLELERALTWEILIVSGKSMTERDIAIALSTRKPQVIARSRWDQLLRLVSAEEIYFCMSHGRDWHYPL